MWYLHYHLIAKKHSYYLYLLNLTVFHSENKDLCELDNLEDYFYIRRKPAADEFSPRKRELIEKAEKVADNLELNVQFNRNLLKISESMIAMSYMIQLSSQILLFKILTS